MVGCSEVSTRRAIMNPVLSLLAFFTDQPWTIPLIGILVASLAFMIGRRWFVAGAAAATKKPAEEPPFPQDAAVERLVAVWLTFPRHLSSP